MRKMVLDPVFGFAPAGVEAMPTERHVAKLRRRMEIEQELRGAIDRDELHLQYQPVVALPDVRPVGAEALLRWQHPVLGKVGPDEFIPVAEECGMISRLGAWVLHQACQQLSHWLAKGHDVWVSVNVSPHELQAPGYVDQVKDALRAHLVPPQRLVLEVTEHALSHDINELIRQLGDLHATGVRIALDEFGAGYFSLGHLPQLPVDILKIDRALMVKEMVRVVVELGHQFGLEVIAEGISDQSQMAMVVDAGCKLGQGFLSGRPVPAEHFENRLGSTTSPRTHKEPTVAGGHRHRARLVERQRLTAGELRVAALAPSATNREIAQALFLSVRTVEAHLTNIYRKLNISNRQQLATAFMDQPEI
jgi:EAL domain-containing protein (putative c-di-GMP-specific phosphodiesterase class I)/DNA-binding CsgD family transcriptional regulator